MSNAAVCLYLSIGTPLNSLSHPLGIASFFIMFGGIHKIPEGYIGVYTRGGALLSGYTNPGVHFMFPLMTKYHTVQITVQTDKVTNIPVNQEKMILYLVRNKWRSCDLFRYSNGNLSNENR
jgi:regulator of protease activity HflC (stomatin/prohibitin superfamily)